MLRLALLVHAASSPSAREDARALGARLLEPDAGFSVVDLPAHDDLALGIPRALEGVPFGATIFVYVGAEIVLGTTGAVEIVGAARNVRFDELRAAVLSISPGPALLVVDGVHAPPDDDPFASAEVAAAVLRAMRTETSGIGTLVALRRPESERGVASLLLAKAEELARSRDDRTAAIRGAYELLRDDEDVHARVATVSLGGGAHDLVLLRPPPARSTFASLPDADEIFAEATRLLDAGQLETALEALKRTLFLVADDPIKRAEVFVRVAAIKQRQGRGREAVFNLEKALSVDARHRTALEGLVLVAAGEKRWDDAFLLAQRLVEVVESVDDRRRAMIDLARIFEDSARDGARAVAFLEQARALGPFDGDVLERLATHYDRARNWVALCDVLEAYAGATTHAYYRSARLAAAAKVAGAALADRPRAITLYKAALGLRPDDADSLAALGALLEAEGDVAEATRAYRDAARWDPKRVATYQALVRLATRASDNELAFSAACVLEHLGEADMDEQLLADQFRPEGALRPSRPLAAAAWETTIAPPLGRAAMAVMEAIDSAAIAAKQDELRKASALPALDEASRVDLATSTLSAARAFSFASKLFDVEVPALAILADVPGGIAALPAERPTTVIGKSVLSGKSLPELAFLMARHLAYHRPGARVALFYPDVHELSALFSAAIAIADPESAPSTRDAALAMKLQSALAARLDDASRDALVAAVRALGREPARQDAIAWLRRLELTATRAGLLAAGDLGVAARLVATDPAPVGDLPADAKIDDLCAFVVSAAHAALRREIGVAVG